MRCDPGNAKRMDMRQFIKPLTLTMLTAAMLALAGCGHSDKASDPASADNVEMPAEETMSGLAASAVPQADASATATEGADASAAAADSAATAAGSGVDASSSAAGSASANASPGAPAKPAKPIRM
jgi:hypothetical protein